MSTKLTITELANILMCTPDMARRFANEVNWVFMQRGRSSIPIGDICEAVKVLNSFTVKPFQVVDYVLDENSDDFLESRDNGGPGSNTMESTEVEESELNPVDSQEQSSAAKFLSIAEMQAIFEVDFHDHPPQFQVSSDETESVGDALQSIISELLRDKPDRVTFDRIESAMARYGLEPAENEDNYQWCIDRLDEADVLVVEVLPEEIPDEEDSLAELESLRTEIDQVLREVFGNHAEDDGEQLTAEEQLRFLEVVREGKRAEQQLLEEQDQESAMHLRAIATKGHQAINELLVRNRRLVASVVIKHGKQARHLSFDDLMQEGMMGLWRGIEKFDLDVGTRLSTYVTWWIRQAVSRAVADQERAIRLPVHLFEKVNRYYAACNELEKRLNREPTEIEIAQQLDLLSPNVIAEIRQSETDDFPLSDLAMTSIGNAVKTVRQRKRLAEMHPVSLDTPVGDAEASTLGDFVPSNHHPSPEQLAVQNDLKESLWLVLSDLNERERHVLTCRFGLDSELSMTLESLGEELDLTRERVRQIEAKALRKLRHPLRSRKLIDFLSGDHPDSVTKRAPRNPKEEEKMMSIVAIRCKKHNRDQRLPLSLQQVVEDEAEGRVMRPLSADGSTLQKGPWELYKRPFKSGLYCQHCMNEGNRSPLDIDVEDWPDLDLADRPIIFLSPNEVRSGHIAEVMRSAFPSASQYSRTLAAIPARFGHNGVLNGLTPSLAQAIRKTVLGESGRLFSFQTDAIMAALDGHDVVVTTPTASGKTLTYLAPIIDALLKDPSANALYLSPLVALTEDQLEAITRLDGSGTDWRAKGARFSNYRVCRKLEFGQQSLTVARYDGQVSPGDRQYIRKVKPQYLLTTPDMLHYALLNGAFDERQWAYFFAKLKYVVIDELHTYRGVFGASFANLLRRLKRVCRSVGGDPQFICASATIQKPQETVERFIGRKPVVIDGAGAGAPQNKREFILWSTPANEDIRALSTQAKDVLLFTLRNKIRTIAFGRSISEINDIYRFVSAELKESGSSEIRITPFMRELTTVEKRNIIGELKQGTLHGAISTTALSMGIDIGSLAAAVIIGFPGSIADLWQQAGRAGRSGEGVVILIADNNPLDQFFVNHPDVLFDLDAEPIYFNPDNPYIVSGHLLCAAREMDLDPVEIESFGPSGATIVEDLLDEGKLVYSESGNLTLSDSMRADFPSIPLRNLSFSIDVITEESREVIVQVDAVRAQKALHRYAHYQHINKYYEVTRYDVDPKSQQGRILVKELENPEYTTTARVDRNVTVIRSFREQSFPSFAAHFGEVHSQTAVAGYYRVPLFARNEPFQYQPLVMAAPRPIEYNTHGLWLTIWPHILEGFTEEEQTAGLYSLTEALRMAIAIEELCALSDLSSVSTVHSLDTEMPTITIHDSVPGGIGITEAASEKMNTILLRAFLILEQCPYCSKHPESLGCPYCVTAQYGDETTINRQVAIDLLKMMIE